MHSKLSKQHIFGILFILLSFYFIIPGFMTSRNLLRNSPIKTPVDGSLQSIERSSATLHKNEIKYDKNYYDRTMKVFESNG